MKRLREEILRKVGSFRRPTYDDLRDMRYLRAVINGMQDLFYRAFYIIMFDAAYIETLRLFPPVYVVVGHS